MRNAVWIALVILASLAWRGTAPVDVLVEPTPTIGGCRPGVAWGEMERRFGESASGGGCGMMGSVAYRGGFRRGWMQGLGTEKDLETLSGPRLEVGGETLPAGSTRKAALKAALGVPTEAGSSRWTYRYLGYELMIEFADGQTVTNYQFYWPTVH